MLLSTRHSELLFIATHSSEYEENERHAYGGMIETKLYKNGVKKQYKISVEFKDFISKLNYNDVENIFNNEAILTEEI